MGWLKRPGVTAGPAETKVAVMQAGTYSLTRSIVAARQQTASSSIRLPIYLVITRDVSSLTA